MNPPTPKIWIEHDTSGKAKDAYWIHVKEKYNFTQSLALTHRELVELYRVLACHFVAKPQVGRELKKTK